MAEQDCLALAKVINHGSDVAGNAAQSIVRDFMWTGALSVAAHIKRSHRVSACSEIFYLVTPRVPEFWKTVYAHDQWTVTGKGDIKFDGSVADADEIQKRLLNLETECLVVREVSGRLYPEMEPRTFMLAINSGFRPIRMVRPAKGPERSCFVPAHPCEQ
jgi:hypothetical protein